MIAELCLGKASNDFGTVGSVILNYGYDYSNFGSQKLQTQAQETLQQFFGFVHQTFVRGLEIGRRFRHLLHELCLEHGLSQGEQRFEDWLRSSDFGGSTWMARSLIQVSEWFDSQRKRIQKLILNSVQSWSISALKELTKVSDEHLLVKLLKAGKQTVNSIRKARHSSLTLGQPVSEADWELVADKFQADEDAVATLQAEAQRLAQVMNSPVLTDHLIEAIETLTEWDVAKLMQSAPRTNKANPAIASFIANAGEPDEVIEEAQLNWIERGLGLDEAGSDQFRSCVRNLARQEAGENGDVTPRHRHVQQALSLQKLAPVVPQQIGKQSYAEGNRLVELERQVKDLSAQLKEADKAAALINGLQAQRDRLERENQQLQGLIQENAQKDLEIHLLQQQIEHLETTRSDEVLEQLVEQNQQLVIQLEETQQRYEALASEMAASKQNLKYADNSQLTAKVMALETQLAEAHRTLEKQQKPEPKPLTVGSYVRIVKHDNRNHCDRLGQVVQLPEQSDTLNRFQVQLSGEKTRIICYSEQMEPVEVFLPPADTFVPVEEAQQQVRSVAEEKQLQIEELQSWLAQATETIARYKDPQKNPQVLQWQQQVTELNARLYDAKKQLNQIQQENQELKKRLDWELSPLGQVQRS
ncbi:hypothetical protein [Laspinema olomoucense]|uniref:hypothetical protein n=1 Tax=Laspinema olomoucense TaxID=3231600 RepID=UPI0021BA7E4B|nr:hypothetical protein [Laspinema sp. D3d]MCT7973400.1 hypothetical protein [Laspinema sp. D3d]